jgi:hypothetical protein
MFLHDQKRLPFALSLYTAMPISDARVLQELLAATESESEPLAWRQAGGRCVSEINGVRLELFPVRSLGIEHLCLCMSVDGHSIYLHQPLNRTLFRREYRSDDDRRLAGLFTALARAAMPPKVRSSSRVPREIAEAMRDVPARQAR